MHMADALISPAVGGTMWAVSAAAVAWCSNKVKESLDERKVPLMGVLGAFVFAAMMITFTIPGTGSSGHLGGGLLLAVLLGPHAAFLVMASILVVQALFFADGGLLALGCNIFNLGFFPAFIAYPLVYKAIMRGHATAFRLSLAAILAAVAGLQLGAFAVVMETTLSGVTALPFSTFVLLMQPIHLAIGLVEGVVTASVISFIWKANPQILEGQITGAAPGTVPLRNIALSLLLAALLVGGFFSWFASSKPDGLEWSITRATGTSEPASPGAVHSLMAKIQEKTAFLPDYSFAPSRPAPSSSPAGQGARPGTTASGILGGLITLALAFLVGFFLKRRSGQKLRIDRS